MAFIDVLDRPNADGCLLAVIQPLTTTGATTPDEIYLSERYIRCETIVPGAGGSYYYSGIIESWGDFGSAGEDLPELVIGDGSIRCRNDRPFGPYGTITELLTDYELHGAHIWIGQMLVEIVSASNIYRTQLLWHGVITHVGNMTKGIAELYFRDRTASTPIIPFSEVTRVGFPDAPEDSIGQAIPIVMGDFSEYSGGSFNPVDLQGVGLGNLAGVPAVITDKHLDVYDEGPDYRISDHLIKDLDTDAGVMLLEPEEEIPGLVHPDDWALVNSTYAGVETDWPMRVKFPVRPDQRGTTYTVGVNHMLACDGDLDSYVVIDPDPGYTGWSSLILRSMTRLGAITEVVVCVWVKTGTGFGRVGLQTVPAGTYHGLYSDVTFTGSDQILRHTVNLSGGWPSDEWDFENYQVTLQLTQDTHYAEIREMWLLVTYVPNRAHREKKKAQWRGLWGGRPKGFAAHRGPPTNKDLWWPTHNPQFLTYSKGVKDDGSGTYTGSANALIENGADMARYFAVNYMGLALTDLQGVGSVGEWEMARINLTSYHKLAMFIDDKVEGREQFELLCQECRAMPTWNANGKLGLVVIDPTPLVDYRAPLDGFDFMPGEHFYADTFKCWRTPIDDLAASVFIEFDYCHALGKFRKTAFITPDGTDNGFGTDDDSTRKTRAGYSESRFGEGREFRLRAYDVRNQGVAKSLRNFYSDNLWRPRVWFQFECGVHACDLSVGNVMRFGVELINGMKVPTPDTANEHWDDFCWYVAGVTRLEQEGDVSRYLVRGFEAIEPTIPADWVAGVDDT